MNLKVVFPLESLDVDEVVVVDVFDRVMLVLVVVEIGSSLMLLLMLVLVLLLSVVVFVLMMNMKMIEFNRRSRAQETNHLLK